MPWTREEALQRKIDLLLAEDEGDALPPGSAAYEHRQQMRQQRDAARRATGATAAWAHCWRLLCCTGLCTCKADAASFNEVDDADEPADALVCRALPLLAGGAFAAGWWIFIDVCVLVSMQATGPGEGEGEGEVWGQGLGEGAALAWTVAGNDGADAALLPRHWLPGLLSTLALAMAAVTPFGALQQTGSLSFFAGSFDGQHVLQRARCWLFASFTLSFASVMAAVVFATAAPPHDAHVAAAGRAPAQGTWIDAAVGMQAMCIFASALLWTAHGLRTAAQDEYC